MPGVINWERFAEEAPHIAEVFDRRHKATGNLCFLATLRSDGSPRISPMEPGILDGELILLGMPNTTKYRDLARDPRFCLHTATVDPYVGEGDAKLWGRAVNLQDKGVHERYADHLLEVGGPDIRGKAINTFYVADITSASCLEFAGGGLTVTSWKPSQGERTRIIS